MAENIQPIVERMLKQIAAIKPRFDVVYDNKVLWEHFAKPIRNKLLESLSIETMPESVTVSCIKETRHEGLVSSTLSVEADNFPSRTMGLAHREDLTAPAPAVLFLQPLTRLEPYEESLARRLLDAGCVIATMDVCAVEERGTEAFQQFFAASALLGQTYLGRLVFDDCVAFKALAQQENVDASRIAVLGVGDSSFRAAALSCLENETTATVCAGGISLFRMILSKRAVSSWLDGQSLLMPFGFLQYADHGQVLACGVPKPLLVTSSKRDPNIPIAGAMESVGYTRRIYAGFVAAENVTHHIEDTDQPLNDAIVDVIAEFLEEKLK